MSASSRRESFVRSTATRRLRVDVARAPEGKVGLAKFRDTRAEFKNFRWDDARTAPVVTASTVARVDKLLGELAADGSAGIALTDGLAADADLSPAALADRADKLAQQAEQLRRLSTLLAEAHVRADLLKLLSEPEEKVDLLAAALCVARLDNNEIDIPSYGRMVDRMAADARSDLAEDADEAARLAALNKFFFEDCDFHGSRGDFDYRANSYLNEVLDDREGLPITLSIIYMNLAKRLGLRVEGVGLPGHFVVRYSPAHGESRLIDVFEGGQLVRAADEAARRVLGRPLARRSRTTSNGRRAVARSSCGCCKICGASPRKRATRRQCCDISMRC